MTLDPYAGPHEVDVRRADALRRYSELRGWTHKGRSFGLSTLMPPNLRRQLPLIYGYRQDPYAPWGFLDHIISWRADRKAVAWTTQPYGCTPDKWPEVVEWATKWGLAVNIPDDFESWWVPGFTTLIEIRRQS